MTSNRSLHLAALAVSLGGAAILDAAPGGNRLAYLDERSPFHVSAAFPRLTTPMWFGEEGVDAAIILSIDDMRDPEKYRVFLEPILARLTRLEGRSPLSILTNTVNTADPRLVAFLEAGVRFDVHTMSHPCPLLRGPLEKAAHEVLDCTALLGAIPGSRPVAFRMPCCDSINSASPRFFSEILPRRTAQGSFLEIDSSVLMFVEPSHRAYAPFANYAATAEGYPYPYVVGKLLWEFPIIAPSDWQAQRRNKPFSPETVADMKANIDRIVEAKGLYTLCFHPHGWIRNDQVVELIDHAAEKHGRRVRFLSFHDALERLNRNLLGGFALRAPDGGDQGVRLLDVNGDGWMDAVIANDERRETRVWDPGASRWRIHSFPFPIASRNAEGGRVETGARFAVLHRDGRASAFLSSEDTKAAAHFDGGWHPFAASPLEPLQVAAERVLTARRGRDAGVRFRDIDGDGLSELLVSNDRQNAAFRWDPALMAFTPLPFALPRPSSIADAEGRDRGLRLADLDGDGDLDALLSNEDEYYFHLFEGPAHGWSRRALGGSRGDPEALPEITRRGEDRGAWVKDGILYVANEDTAEKKDLVDVVRLSDLARAAPGRSD